MSSVKVKVKKSMKEREFINDKFTDNYVAETSLDNKYLTFSIMNRIYCVSLNYVTEIINVLKINEVPVLPRIVKGVINLRGKIIPIIDIRNQLKINDDSDKIWVSVIIIKINGSLVGIKADKIQQLLSISRSEKDTLPVYNYSGIYYKYADAGKNVPENSKVIVDAENIINPNDLSIINEQIENEIRPLSR